MGNQEGYAGTVIGADGTRYSPSDPLLPTTDPRRKDFARHGDILDVKDQIDAIDDSTRVLPTGLAASLVAAATLLVPITSAVVTVNLNNANDAPILHAVNPGLGKYADVSVIFANADDSTSPVVTLPPYILAPAANLSAGKLVAPASTKSDHYRATIIGAASKSRSIVASTATSTALVATSGAFTSADVNARVTGAGIPAGAYIASVTDGTHAVLSAATTATATGVAVAIVTSPGSVLLVPVRVNF